MSLVTDAKVVVISGGVGAARLLRGLHRRVEHLTAIVNVADDLVLHGLHISPDIDTILYTLAGAVSVDRGWGLEGETWQAMDMLGRYGGEDWFSLGDRDLGTHLYRTQRLNQGATLTAVSDELRHAWDLELDLLPVTDDPVRTMITISEGGPPQEITFQEYFVARQHNVPVTHIRLAGIDCAAETEGVTAALETADRIVIAPSNPLVSIDPVVAVGEVRQRLTARRDDVIAVSPIIGGEALKGPAARLMTELGMECSAVGVARHYSEICGTLVIDTVDASLASEIEALGVRSLVTDTVMSQPGVLRSLCDTLLG
ncbi:MAG: 2-phospho-L-lactate transferase [Acidimicrobiia bacterium]|nr:2-phospho-L-lactate transferase [Acidimicrobiia bacterium]